MNPLPQEFPPGHIWIEVMDLPSALLALELLLEHHLQYGEDHSQSDFETE